MESFGNRDWTDNWTIGTGLRMEIMDTATSDVWLCQAEVDEHTPWSLTVPDGFRVSGVAGAVADEAWFDRSPGNDDVGPVDTMEVDGLRFARIARPMRFDTVGPIMLMTIDKHHTMRYQAGRTIEVIDRGDDTVLAPAWTPTHHVEFVARENGRELPDGWSMVAAVLTADLVARVPHPATVAVLGDGSGFHGPILRSLIDEAAR